MAKAKKITKEELEKATKVSQEYNGTMQAVGNLELQKQDFLIQAAKVRASVEEIQKDLQEKYGDVNIDLATGEYKKNEDNKKD
jgi:hypothetical protein